MADPLEQFRPRERLVARSVFDRLLDDAPQTREDPPRSVKEQAREMREMIRRDLQALLNTRRSPMNAGPALTELKNALSSYGVDGILSANLVSDVAKLQLARAIERRISMFETRLSAVTVTIMKNRNEGDRALRLRIRANFLLQEGSPPISFESHVDPSTQQFLVEADHG